MVEYELIRNKFGVGCTLGVLGRVGGMNVYTTLEDIWLDNKVGLSCIPAGEYICRRHSGRKYQHVWEVCDVEGRTKILIHWGNYDKDTTGCILIGLGFEGASMITRSKLAFDLFMNETSQLKEFLLKIV